MLCYVVMLRPRLRLAVKTRDQVQDYTLFYSTVLVHFYFYFLSAKSFITFVWLTSFSFFCTQFSFYIKLHN